MRLLRPLKIERPNEIVQKVVEKYNDLSIQLTSTSQGKKWSLNSSRNQNKAKYSATDEALAIMKDIGVE